MKLINPIGRIVNLGVEDNISARACKCSVSGGNFAGGRGPNDKCWHCGCDCTGSASNRMAGNNNDAALTIRKS